MKRPAAAALDAETQLAAAPADHKSELRLWLRLFACSTLIERSIRRRLHRRFGETLPRFDLLAQLERSEGGMTLSELSHRMMVSNGNLTALVERLAAAGLIDRRTAETDRRAQVVTLTAAGRRAFRRMAAEHEGWIAEMTAGLSRRDTLELMRLLAKLKSSARQAIEQERPPEGSRERRPKRLEERFDGINLEGIK
jgi:DNA-binding MarR family transcriptional regulator